MKIMSHQNKYKEIIEKELRATVDFEEASDGVNLLYTAKINGCTVANVYKSYNAKMKKITIIRYTND